MKIKHLLAVLAFTVATGAAYAGDDKSFDKIDADKSGSIDKKEAAAVPELSEQWVILDSNMSDTLDEAEFARFEVGSGD